MREAWTLKHVARIGFAPTLLVFSAIDAIADAILLEARIMAVADVMEATSSHGRYHPGLGIDKALTEIEHGRGTAYDPVVADACLMLFREKGYALSA